MNTYIFTGLSVSFDDAKKILDANYLPPVKRGDIDTLLGNHENIDVIAIIDGVFHQSPAVSHKEILRALKKGITVVGGSSMGALRACELYPYGMIGVGHIFEDYKNGIIESDDDVAVALNPDTLEQLSESLINIRYNLQEAYNNNIISDEELMELLKITKNIYYPKRSFKYIIGKSSLEDNKKEILCKYIEDNHFDIKTLDAISVIKYVKELTADESD